VVAEWFEVVTGADLQQGDVLVDCPVARPRLVFPIKSGNLVEVDIEERDLIVMTQSCDLVQGQRRGNADVVLCGVPLLSDLSMAQGHVLANKSTRQNLPKYSVMGWHVLERSTHAEVVRGQSAVNFGQVFTVPYEFVRQTADLSGKRLRLRSPYREFLAQRFGQFFARIALSDSIIVD
jgi:hypothetical protein